MSRCAIPLVVSFLSLLAVGVSARAEERPFLAWGTGGLVFQQELLVGEGNATHLGKSLVIVTLDENELHSGNLVPRVLAIRGAHDAVFASVDAAFDPETGILAGTITFTGGGPRFEDATGSANLLIVFDEFFNFDFYMDGIIDF